MAFWKKNNGSMGIPEEKKPNLFRRLFQKLKNIDWKNPVNRWKLLVAVILVLVGMGAFVGGAIAFTNQPSFCSNCHEMGAEYVTHKASAHSQIECVQCHVKPGPVNEVVHKVESLKEVYYHVVGLPTPIVQTVPVENENCKQCHSDERSITASGDRIVEHEKHIKEEIPCITCHSGVAHAKIAERGLNDFRLL